MTSKPLPVMRTALEQIQELHAKTYWTGQDEVWELNAKCDECRNAYPCATRKMADEALTDRMARNTEFTADDLRDMTPAPTNPNWTGKVFQDYARQKLIVKTGYEMSRSKARRGGTLARWIGVMRRATV